MIIRHTLAFQVPHPTDTTRISKSDEATGPSEIVRTKRGVANTLKLWPQQHPLTLSFMDVADKDKVLIRSAIESYAPLVNLKFTFVDGESDGDIRISTYKGQGNWSELGIDALEVPRDEPTLNINVHNTDTRTIQKNTLHEFGHALGLQHEHQHPQRPFTFNKADIYKTFGASGEGWGTITSNILTPLDPAGLQTTAYDKKSIMHYKFFATSTSDKVEIPANFELSQGDRDFLKSLYPSPAPRRGK